MEVVKIIFKTIIGYAGSSENPAKMSARFSAIVIALIAKFTPTILMILSVFMNLPEEVTAEMVQQSFGPIVQAFAYAAAGGLYLWGLARAVYVALKTKNLGALYGG